MMDTRDDVLALVRSSAELVGNHDRDGWFGIFGTGFRIEDPVGWIPVDASRIGKFWDTFIAPNDIVFEVHREWIHDLVVIRDVTINTTLQTGVVVTTPAILRYECFEDGGSLRVKRMAAYWDPAPQFGQLMKPQAANLKSMVSMTGRMMRVLGPVDVMRFGGAAMPVSSKKKAALVAQLGVDEAHKVFVHGGRIAVTATMNRRPIAVLGNVVDGSVHDPVFYTEVA